MLEGVLKMQGQIALFVGAFATGGLLSVSSRQGQPRTLALALSGICCLAVLWLNIYFGGGLPTWEISAFVLGLAGIAFFEDNKLVAIAMLVLGALASLLFIISQIFTFPTWYAFTPRLTWVARNFGMLFSWTLGSVVVAGALVWWTGMRWILVLAGCMIVANFVHTEAATALFVIMVSGFLMTPSSPNGSIRRAFVVFGLLSIPACIWYVLLHLATNPVDAFYYNGGRFDLVVYSSFMFWGYGIGLRKVTEAITPIKRRIKPS